MNLGERENMVIHYRKTYSPLKVFFLTVSMLDKYSEHGVFINDMNMW